MREGFGKEQTALCGLFFMKKVHDRQIPVHTKVCTIEKNRRWRSCQH